MFLISETEKAFKILLEIPKHKIFMHIAFSHGRHVFRLSLISFYFFLFISFVSLTAAMLIDKKDAADLTLLYSIPLSIIQISDSGRT